jgi:hypothetical protein
MYWDEEISHAQIKHQNSSDEMFMTNQIIGTLVVKDASPRSALQNRACVSGYRPSFEQEAAPGLLAQIQMPEVGFRMARW